MSEINFVKMQGLGNDFIIVEDSSLPEDISYSELAKKMCDRHFGIGGDGLIIVNPRDVIYDTDTAWRIFNSDGSEPEMCGNGIRCFAKYVYDNNIVDKSQFTVTTLAGVITPSIEKGGLVKVNMGKPILKPAEVPVKSDKDKVINEPFKIMEKEYRINCVSMGNPHCVIFTDEQEDVVKYGSAIELDPIFPQKTNVEFVTVINKEHLKVDVWERGCGITLACGTGACACLYAAFLNGYTGNIAKVTLPGGDLVVEYDEKSGNIFKTGPAEYSFKGVFLG